MYVKRTFVDDAMKQKVKKTIIITGQEHKLLWRQQHTQALIAKCMIFSGDNWITTRKVQVFKTNLTRNLISQNAISLNKLFKSTIK